MAYGKSKDLLKRAQPDNFLRDKAFKIATDPSFLIKRVLVEQLNKSQILNLQVNFIDRKLENLRDEKFINLLETIFEVLIQLICNHWVNITKESSIYCVQWIYLVNMFGLFLSKIKKETSIVDAFKKIISKGKKTNKIWVDQDSEFTIIPLKIF